MAALDGVEAGAERVGAGVEDVAASGAVGVEGAVREDLVAGLALAVDFAFGVGVEHEVVD